MRNLEHYSLNRYDYEFLSKITYDFIDKYFEMCDYEMSSKKNIKKCYYYPDIKFIEAIKVSLLDIFDSNTAIIRSTLMNQDEPISTPCRKYICECVKTYDGMQQNYCLYEAGYEKHKNTCSRLEKFRDTYKLYIQNNEDLKDKYLH
ncbi:hypothetical protein PCYB_002710 [Plasmodium cynomolgi strain B]|uniref:CYIR protein n=1 Tax=Plasmodium cynomolgi (strain B) TaxID=1120755 RepID=K6VJF2_PLACD|nr:hypothetical protein PCYB_002710 [Plasmodium cynomolgi strain B]GAB69522.1 hypothetical protein PCYB_002710 [Plasmodium cynomolgi strain B]